MRMVRYLLLPIVPIYWLITWLRNFFYDKGIFTSTGFDYPIICVGNLSVGGTGKSPMVEYLIKLLNPKYLVATLSRGYKRKTHGFLLAENGVEVGEIGDEPFQFWQKFPEIKVAVDADRVRGIRNLLALTPKPEVILLDDGYQHRRLRAGFYILLTSYHNLYVDDILLPTGNLREPISGASRANIIVVTKCPADFSDINKEQVKSKINPRPNQSIYFSHIEYSDMVISNSGNIAVAELSKSSITLITGIANATPLVDYLKSQKMDFKHYNFPDHHNFRKDDFKDINTYPILTTEKDFIKISKFFGEDQVYYLPIETKLDREAEFNAEILSFCSSYSMGAAEL